MLMRSHYYFRLQPNERQDGMTAGPAFWEARVAREDVDMDIIAEHEHAEQIRNLIAVRAYELWEDQGRPRGCDAVHWYQAEQDVVASVANGKHTGASNGAKAKAAKAATPAKPKPVAATVRRRK
jgi:hypothetical protein